MKKHKFNIFPEAKPEDYQRLKQDIADNGYDESQPIYLYQGEILDGWNRQKACNELNVKPKYETFKGTDEEAICFMMRTNKRRNLNSGQWSCIAVEAEELVAAIRKAVEAEGLAKRTGRPKRDQLIDSVSEAVKGGKIRPLSAGAFIEDFDRNEAKKSSQKIDETSSNQKRSDHKTAELFNTNRTYVNQANKLKTEAPEVFEAVKSGTMRMTDATKAVKAIPKDPWRPDERQRQELCKSGKSVVANASNDLNLIQWANSQSIAVRIDRGTDYGNPFVLGKDGNRDQVCDAYEKHYLPHKPSIINDIQKLKGKVLICHCYPERCHGNCLCDIANER